jgi:hypothetical protein
MDRLCAWANEYKVKSVKYKGINKEEKMLPTVDFCGLTVTRLIIGANPFGGFSHQSEERNREMVEFYTPDKIIETWQRAEAAGINTMITNNESPNVMEALKEYLAGGGKLQWIAQLNSRFTGCMFKSIDEAVDIGCKAFYVHGGHTEKAFEEQDEESVKAWCDAGRAHGVPVGVAGHAPDAHTWMYGLDAADFHVVCFFNCGSLHDGKGHRFHLSHMGPAVQTIRSIKKPCIGYKIMGAGRIDPLMAFEYAFDNIKPTDAVNVGMYRGDKDDIVEENAGIVKSILER